MGRSLFAQEIEHRGLLSSKAEKNVHLGALLVLWIKDKMSVKCLAGACPNNRKTCYFLLLHDIEGPENIPEGRQDWGEEQRTECGGHLGCVTDLEFIPRIAAFTALPITGGGGIRSRAQSSPLPECNFGKYQVFCLKSHANGAFSSVIYLHLL